MSGGGGDAGCMAQGGAGSEEGGGVVGGGGETYLSALGQSPEGFALMKTDPLRSTVLLR